MANKVADKQCLSIRSFRGSGEEFAALAPKLTEQEMQAVNGLFRAFIFKITRKGEYWTSCCRRHVILSEERTVTAEMREILDVPHTPEPQYRYYKLLNPESETRAVCPHCGAEVTVKELERTGRRGNLWSYRRAVVLRWHRGSLWAVGVEAKKTYDSHSGPLDDLWVLTAWPHIHRCAIERFRPGMAEFLTRGWWVNSGWPTRPDWQTGPCKSGLPFSKGDPFGYCQEYGKGYDVIGWEEIQKSPFRYVGIRDIKKKTGVEALRLLTMACFYPGQMEMLHKFGMDEIIRDFCERGVKNAWLLDWETTDRRAFLRLPMKLVLEAFAGDGGRQSAVPTLEGLRIWQRNGQKDELEDCLWLEGNILDRKMREWVRAKARAWGVRLGRVANYLTGQQAAGRTVQGTAATWRDYLDAAEHLGLDLNNDVIRFPRNLLAAHDERCGAWRRICDREKAEKEFASYEPRYRKLCKKYAFELDGLRVIVPESSTAIIREGKVLKHCVGGYADRHLQGKTTILFLRKTELPNTSLITIEMDGNKIRQAHGYRNEWEACPDNPDKKEPQELYKDFFHTWIWWIQKGSPRDKDGKPKMKKKRGTENQSTTERKAG